MEEREKQNLDWFGGRLGTGNAPTGRMNGRRMSALLQLQGKRREVDGLRYKWLQGGFRPSMHDRTVQIDFVQYVCCYKMSLVML